MTRTLKFLPLPVTSKTDAMVRMLAREEGASLPELMATTGWQAHSVRGAIAGTLRRRKGLAIISEKTDAGRIYRIATEPTAS